MPSWISGVSDCENLKKLNKLPTSDILIVASGTFLYYSEPLSQIEVFDLSDPDLLCEHSWELSVPVKGATGGIISLDNGTQVPIICGGFTTASYDNVTQDCYILGNSSMPFANLSVPRGWAASVPAVNDKTLWVAGGTNGPNVWLG